MTLDYYITSGGPDTSTLDTHEFMEGVWRFLVPTATEIWSVDDLEAREHGNVAIYAHLWGERSMHRNEEFDFGEAVTAVPLFEGGRWRRQAHGRYHGVSGRTRAPPRRVRSSRFAVGCSAERHGHGPGATPFSDSS